MSQGYVEGLGSPTILETERNPAPRGMKEYLTKLAVYYSFMYFSHSFGLTKYRSDWSVRVLQADYQELFSVDKCNEFAYFFRSKVENIRLYISIKSLNISHSELLTSLRDELNTLSNFNLVDRDTLEKTVQSLSSSTSELDILLTSFFKYVLHQIVTDVLSMIYTSLLTGTFHKSLKMAIVKPVLKTNNLDGSVLNNYRPIWYLPFTRKIIEKKLFLFKCLLS